MAEIQACPTLQYLGMLEQSLYLTAQVAKHPDSEELLLVNRIPHDKRSRAFFRDLYGAYCRRGERSDFLELFSMQQEFYAVFRYCEGPSLLERYEGCRGAVGKRIQLLTTALFQVYTAAGNLPEPVVCSLLQPENLLVDDVDRIHLRYLLHPEFFLEESGCSMWEETASLMQFLLGRELKKAYHKTLRTIYKKCSAGLYPSLPALIHDLEQAAEGLTDAGPVQALKTFVLRKKARLVQISWVGMVTLILCLVVYLITSLTGQQTTETRPISDIGTVTYVASQKETGDSLLLTDPPVEPEQEDVTFTGVPDPSTPLRSEDYIVQSGDTLDSVCVTFYGSAAYGPLVAGFNGIEADGPLEAGTILRMPLRDQLAQYLKD